jgi:hypothetical protein
MSISFKDVPNRAFPIGKALTVYPPQFTVNDILKVFTDGKAITLDRRVDSYKQLCYYDEKQESGLRHVCFKGVWPLISRRDVVAAYKVYRLKDGVTVFVTCSVDDERFPESSSYVRAYQMWAAFLVPRVDGSGVNVINVMDGDLKIPAAPTSAIKFVMSRVKPFVLLYLEGEETCDETDAALARESNKSLGGMMVMSSSLGGSMSVSALTRGVGEKMVKAAAMAFKDLPSKQQLLMPMTTGGSSIKQGMKAALQSIF